jgi:hypothetical protein
VDGQLPLRILTPIRGQGRQEFTGRFIMRGTACLASVCVQAVLKDATWGWAPSGRRGLTPRLQRRSRRLCRTIAEVSKSGAARRTIFRHKIQQNTARSARTVLNVAVCRTFLRSVLLWVINPQGMVIDRHDKYRPRIDRLEMSRFAGLSPRYWSLRSMRSLLSRPLPMGS